MIGLGSFIGVFWILGLTILGASSLTYHHAIWDTKRYLKHHHPETWRTQIGDFELKRPFLSSYRLRMFVHENRHLPLLDPVLNRKIKIVWATYFGIGTGGVMIGVGSLALAFQ
jgi:hypothetical protein